MLPRYLYNVLLYIITPFVLMRLALLGLKNHGYWHRIGERFGIYKDKSQSDPCIWLHAVSVGEVRAAVPLVVALQAEYGDYQILLTTTTPTGSDQVLSIFRDNVQHCYAPYDLPFAVKQFLRIKRPVVAIFMETEIWPNIFHQCRINNIPTAIVNARISDKSFGGYRKVKKLTQLALADVSYICPQTRVDKDRLMAIGAVEGRIEVIGNLKYEMDLSETTKKEADNLKERIGRQRPILLAASTHDGEDQRILNIYRKLKLNHSELVLIIVPRHPERFPSVYKLCQDAGFSVIRRSEGDKSLGKPFDILLGDTMGELVMFYGAATIAFVGGSLVPAGGHNILEGMAMGIPVLFGPHMENFEEMKQRALDCGAAYQGQDEQELETIANRLLKSPEERKKAGSAGWRMVEANKGALEKTMAIIQRLMASQIKK